MNIYFFCGVIISKSDKTVAKLYIMHCGRSRDRNHYFMELRSKEYVSEITFSKYCSFDFHGDVINPKTESKRAPTCISCTAGDNKMKVNSKGKFEVKYSSLKPLSQNFKVLASLGDVANPKMGKKARNWYFMYQRW